MQTQVSRIVALSLLVLLTTACGESRDGSPQPTVGGVTECTVDAVQPFLTAYVEAGDPNNQMPIRDLQCAEGWAVASGILGPKDTPADGPQGAPTSVILEAEGQFWIVKEKADVCGTYSRDDPASRPGDALIPVDLYLSGCLAG